MGSFVTRPRGHCASGRPGVLRVAVVWEADGSHGHGSLDVDGLAEKFVLAEPCHPISFVAIPSR